MISIRIKMPIFKGSKQCTYPQLTVSLRLPSPTRSTRHFKSPQYNLFFYFVLTQQNHLKLLPCFTGTLQVQNCLIEVCFYNNPQAKLGCATTLRKYSNIFSKTLWEVGKVKSISHPFPNVVEKLT